MGTGSQLEKLAEISRCYGQDEEFVLAGGGNTSFKDEDHLYVKASGVKLADIQAEGFVKMSRRKLRALCEKEYPTEPAAREEEVLKDIMDCREPGEEAKRPSVEVMLHELIGFPFVVHTHPPMANGLTCGRVGEKAAGELFGDDMLWIPTVEPGYVLSMTVWEKLREYESRFERQPNILLMQNHGLLVGGAAPEAVQKVTRQVMDKIRSKIAEAPDFSEAPFDRGRAVQLAPALRMMLRESDGSSVVVFHTNKEIQRLVASEKAFRPVSSAFTPDHIVYCNPEPLFVGYERELQEQYLSLGKAVEQYRKRFGYPPRIVAVQQVGVFCCSPNLKQAGSARDLFRDQVKVARYSSSFGGPNPLPDWLVEFVDGWEVESYRRRVYSGASGAGRLNERIAIVTGGAQGIGKGIADYLVSQGANVTVADIQVDAAIEAAEALNLSAGIPRAMAAKTDVTEEVSVSRAVEETVLAYGGLDLYVSNAGIIEAGGLDQLEVESFEKVTRVNYMGYYLGARVASRIMKLQHRFDPHWFMDIVQVNSKSGLLGSKRNFAYAGGKAGGIGLTQSFALELVEENIKVNAICPGNYFDGPLWSDPEKGLFVLYMKAGKIPGAETVEDVRKHYESQIPMGRGCRIEDICRALLYIVEQEYETGQAVPVTGGQIMLK